MNNEFLRQYKRISKRHSRDFTLMLPDLKDHFASLLRDFPKEMILDLSDYFFNGDLTDDNIQRAADVIDLYNEDFNGEDSFLTANDWSYLKELVNSFAVDLDIDWVAYFMQFILDRNIL